jgi:ATP-binding cassette subfamily B protein
MIMIAIVVSRHQDDRRTKPRPPSTVIATIVLFISLRPADLRSASATVRDLLDFMASQAGAEKVGQLLDAKVDIVDKKEIIAKYGDIFNPKKDAYEKLKGEIDFENVTFGYGNGVEVIHPLTLHVKEGTSLAIVGETGSGKTTMVNLICRFYEPTKGKIYVDGVDYLDKLFGLA